MAAPSLQQLFSDLSRLHLVEPQRLEELQRRKPAGAQPRMFADELVECGWITAYQADLLLQGRGDQLLLGSYVLMDKLGEGGMGAVFRARNWKLGRIAAVKLIRKECLSSPDAVRRFYREIRAAAQLDHPHVVRAYDADEVNGTHYFSMEFVDGIDLARLVREHGPLPVGLACEYTRQAALGLQHAHERGLVHRDIKPANLLLARAKGPGVIKVLDLGLARQEDTVTNEQSGTLTQIGMLMGTPDYMAPEQSISSHTVDIRADLYGLGCSLYFLLTGSVPFPGGSLTEKLIQHQIDQPKPIEMLRSDVPSAVADIVYKLMAKKPAERFQTPEELAIALEAILKTPHIWRLSTSAKFQVATADGPEFPTDPFWHGIAAEGVAKTADKPAWKKKRWAMVGIAAAAIIVLGIVLAIANQRPAITAPHKDNTGKAAAARPNRFALEFDGASAHVVVHDFKYQGDHPLTLEAWVTPSWTDANMSIFANLDVSGIGLGIEKGVCRFTMHDATGYRRAFGEQLRPGQRVHLAGVFDGKELRIYVDGKAMGRSDWNAPHKVSSLPCESRY